MTNPKKTNIKNFWERNKGSIIVSIFVTIISLVEGVNVATNIENKVNIAILTEKVKVDEEQNKRLEKISTVLDKLKSDCETRQLTLESRTAFLERIIENKKKKDL